MYTPEKNSTSSVFVLCTDQIHHMAERIEQNKTGISLFAMLKSFFRNHAMLVFRIKQRSHSPHLHWNNMLRMFLLWQKRSPRRSPRTTTNWLYVPLLDRRASATLRKMYLVYPVAVCLFPVTPAAGLASASRCVSKTSLWRTPCTRVIYSLLAQFLFCVGKI